MKKLFNFVLLGLIVSFIFAHNNVKAVKKEPIKNILDLKNIAIYPKDNGQLYSAYSIVSIEDIPLEAGKYYTLVVDKTFYRDAIWGSSNFNLPPLMIYLYDEEHPNTGSLFEDYFTVEEDYVYYTFYNGAEWLDIINIPVDENERGIRSNNIMLYQGTIEDFISFSSYYSNYEVEKGVFIMDYDYLMTTEEIMAQFSLSDNKDTITEDNIYFYYNELLTDTLKIGSYKTMFSVSDSSNNKSYFELETVIVDITPPTIEGTDYYVLQAGVDLLDIYDIYLNLTIGDNYTSVHYNDINIVQDTYSANKNKVGEYIISLELEDESNNKTSFNIILNVIDEIPPVITGPREIYRYTTDEKLTHSDIQKLFQANDNIDGNLTNNLIYTGDYNHEEVGTYKIYVEVTDSSGNKTQKQLIVNVVDNVPPVITTNEFILSYEDYSQMTKEDIISWLESLIVEAENIFIVYNENDYIVNSKEETYIYFSYTVEGTPYYARIVVNPSKNILANTIIGISGVLIFNIGFLIIYIKKRKKYKSII